MRHSRTVECANRIVTTIRDRMKRMCHQGGIVERDCESTRERSGRRVFRLR